MTQRKVGGVGGDPAGFGLAAADWDLLADYVGGALEDTPDEAVVARRVAEDPLWGLAHAALTEATAGVTADLRAWGDAPAAMPDDVADRLTAALADAGATADAGPPPRLSERAGRRGLSVVPGGGDGSARPMPPARAAAARRWRRWATPITAAAAVIAVLGFGLNLLWPRASTPSSSTSERLNSAGAPAAKAPYDTSGGQPGSGTGSTRALSRLPVGRFAVSGTNYRADTISAAVKTVREAGDSAVKGTQPPGLPPNVSPAPASALGESAVGAPLRRLAAVGSLTDCLNAVGQEHTSEATSIELVDYASFDGSPAVVVVFTDSTGQRQVWVVGPACGVPGRGADTRYHAAIG